MTALGKQYVHERILLALVTAAHSLGIKVDVAMLSYLLGYSEPSNFHRAFRRWTGVTPAEWRECH